MGAREEFGSNPVNLRRVEHEPWHEVGCRNGPLLRRNLPGPEACHQNHKREDGKDAGDEGPLHYFGFGRMPSPLQRMPVVLSQAHLSVLAVQFARDNSAKRRLWWCNTVNLHPPPFSTHPFTPPCHPTLSPPAP